MGRLFNLFKKFRADERGIFGVVFAVLAITLIALGGAVVDFVSIQQTRNRAQVALDAAALALQKDIFVVPLDKAGIQSRAQALVVDRIGDTRITATVNAPVVDVSNGSLYLSANVKVPTIFVALVGVNNINATIASEANRRKVALEVAMVLDNSGSMLGSRMSNLKTAATCATNILFYGDVTDTNCAPISTAKKVEDVSIGIVPFTVMVNIGTQFKDAAWLDWTGKASVSRINFDDDDDEDTPFIGPFNRKTLFTLTNTSWGGCVEARKTPYDTTDEPPVNSAGKYDTLFTPLFTPDAVSAYNNFAAGQLNYLSDTGGLCPIKTCQVVTKNGNKSYTLTVGTTITTPGASCIPATNPVRISTKTSGSTTTEVYSLLSRLELQSRICKYSGNTAITSAKTNDGCPAVDVLPLTDTPKQVFDKIDEMVAAGSTNIQQGAIWGVHALSHEEPLPEGRPRNDTDVRKAMILMTDGENDPPFVSGDFNGGSYFSWGFPYDGRLATYDNQVDTETKVRAIQDAKTLAACQTAKAAGMEVFTIGLSSPTAVKTMLSNCSSGAGFAFFPNKPEDLIATFRAIAEQLAPLRLTQ